MKTISLLFFLCPLLAWCKEETLTLPLDAPVLSTVNPHFICYTSDWWTNSDGWGDGTSLLNLDFNNPKLQAAAAALSPTIWRIGGTRADKILYDLKDYGDASAHDENKNCRRNWCLSRRRWLEALDFAKKVNTPIVFTLNYIMYTESKQGDKNTIDEQPWDSTAARQLMELTKEVAPAGLIYGFELGNEVQHGSISVDLGGLGAAYKELSSIIKEVWPEADGRPKLLGPATSGSHYDHYLPYIGEYLDILTYHKYQHTGKDPELSSLILKPDFLWKSDIYTHEVKPAADYGLKEVWIGEGAMASHSGRANVTDTFLSTLWFANALGSMSKAQPLPVRTFCRQTLLGGYYGLLDQPGLDPNPDFHMIRIWKHLVGQQTLDSIESTFEDNDLLRVHAFCGVTTGEVVLIFVSIDEMERTISIPMGSSRDVYQLKGKPDVAGKEVLLNGALQFMAEDGSLPEMVPVKESPQQGLVIPPRTVTFAVLHETGITACGSHVAEPPVSDNQNSEQEKSELIPATAPPKKDEATPVSPMTKDMKQEQSEHLDAAAPPPSNDASSPKSHFGIWLLLIVAFANVLVAIILRNEVFLRKNDYAHVELSQFDPELSLDRSAEGYKDNQEIL